MVQFYRADGDRLSTRAEPYDESSGVTEIPEGAAYVRLYFEQPDPPLRVVGGVLVHFGHDTDDG